MNSDENKELQELIQRIPDLPLDSTERRKLINGLLDQLIEDIQELSLDSTEQRKLVNQLIKDIQELSLDSTERRKLVNQLAKHLIKDIQQLPPDSRERRKLWNALLKQISGYYLIVKIKRSNHKENGEKNDRTTSKEVRVPGILMPCEKLFDEDLNSLCGKKSRVGTPLRYLVPQKWMQEELYAEAKVDTLLYIRKNIDKYDAEKGTVKTWVDRTLCFKLLDAFNKRYRGGKYKGKKDKVNKLQIKAHAASLDAPNSESTSTLADNLPSRTPSKKHENHRLLREFIEDEPEDFLKNVLIKNRETGNQISLQEVLLMRFEGRTFKKISEKTGIPFQSIQSCVTRKTKELKEYITKHTGITSDDL